MADEIETVRRFNRSYTPRIGALDESFLGMGLPLGPIRLMFEIGSAPGTIQALRRRLGLDSGYMSRLLRRLQSESLVEVVPDPDDRRRRLVRLTDSGRQQWSVLEKTLADPGTGTARALGGAPAGAPDNSAGGG